MGIRPHYQQAFGAHKIKQGQWYTYNHGGRNEMQFNIGMVEPKAKSPGYLRVGLAWNIYGPSRIKVNNSLESFRNLIREVRSWDAFVKTNRLEIEWIHRLKKDSIAQRQTNDITEWLLREPFPQYDWILIGRLLQRDIDTVTLADPARLKNVIDSVFSGFLPLWEETQYSALTPVELQIKRRLL